MAITGISEDFIKAIEEAVIDLRLHHGRYEMSHILRMHSTENRRALQNVMITKGLIFSPDENVPTNCSLTPYGWTFTTFKNEEEKEQIDFKLKEISYNSARLNKWLPLYALFIAILTAAVPLIIYYISKNDVQKSNTEVPQLMKMQEKQDSTLLLQKNYLDSLSKLINAQNVPGSDGKK